MDTSWDAPGTLWACLPPPLWRQPRRKMTAGRALTPRTVALGRLPLGPKMLGKRRPSLANME